ncbi:hypothetical protein EON64_05935, partial [archaeon]
MESSNSHDSRNSMRVLPYTIIPGTVYQIACIVFDPASFVPSFSRQLVAVVPSNIQALIVGGPEQSIGLYEGLTLDASSSYDADQNPEFYRGFSANLRFLWSCASLTPIVSEKCNLDILSPLTSQRITVSASDTSINATSLFRVVVTKDRRQSEAMVKITVVASATLSVISFLQPAPGGKPFNVDKPLTLQMQVTRPTADQIELVVEELNRERQSNVVQSTQYINLNDARRSPGVFYYSLPPNTLKSGTSYLLKAKEVGSSMWTSISVSTNNPPKPGLFEIQMVGEATLGKHMFRARMWTDEHLPLFYTFGYMTSTGSKLLVQPKSQHSTAFARLFSSNVSVTCFLDVYDALDAVSSLQHNVILVGPSIPHQIDINSIIVPTSFVELISNLIYAPELQSIAASIVQMNSVSCEFAPDCVVLNRQSCKDASNTCGVCLSGFVGVNGDSNSPCISTADVSLLTMKGICSVDADCPTLMVCDLGVCVPQPKQCPMDCSGHGQCAFIDRVLGAKVDLCSIVDLFCVAQCDCDEGFGGDGCQRSSSQLSGIISERQEAINYIQYVLGDTLLATSFVKHLSMELAQVARSPGELSDIAGSAALASAMTVINSLAGANSSFSDLLPALQVLDVVQQTTFSPQLMSQILPEVETRIYQVVNVGSSSAQFVGQVYRAAFNKFLVTQPLLLSLPASPLEQAFSTPLPKAYTSLAFSSSNHKAVLPASLQLLNSQVVQTTVHNISSVPVRIGYDDRIGCSGFGCEVSVDIYFNKPLNNVVIPQQFQHNCSNVEEIKTFVCDSGEELQVYCTGNEDSVGVKVAICGYTSSVPVCSKMVDTEITDELCTRVSFDAIKITCMCDFSASVSGRRKLQSGYLSSAMDIIVTMQYEQVSSYIGVPATPTAQPTYQPSYPRIGLIIHTKLQVQDISTNISVVNGEIIRDSLYEILHRNITDIEMGYLNATIATVGDINLMSEVTIEAAMSMDTFCSINEAFMFYDQLIVSSLGLNGRLNSALSSVVAASSSSVLSTAFISSAESRIVDASSIPSSTPFCVERANTPSPTVAPTSISQGNSGGDTINSAGDSGSFSMFKSPGVLATYVGVLVFFVVLTVGYIILSNRNKVLMSGLADLSSDGEHKDKDRSLILGSLQGLKANDGEYNPERGSADGPIDDNGEYSYSVKQYQLSPPPMYSAPEGEEEELSPSHASMFGLEHLSPAKNKAVNRGVGALKPLGGRRSIRFADVAEGLGDDISLDPSESTLQYMQNLDIPPGFDDNASVASSQTELTASTQSSANRLASKSRGLNLHQLGGRRQVRLEEISEAGTFGDQISISGELASYYPDNADMPPDYTCPSNPMASLDAIVKQDGSSKSKVPSSVNRNLFGLQELGSKRPPCRPEDGASVGSTVDDLSMSDELASYYPDTDGLTPAYELSADPAARSLSPVKGQGATTAKTPVSRNLFGLQSLGSRKQPRVSEGADHDVDMDPNLPLEVSAMHPIV